MPLFFLCSQYLNLIICQIGVPWLCILSVNSTESYYTSHSHSHVPRPYTQPSGACRPSQVPTGAAPQPGRPPRGATGTLDAYVMFTSRFNILKGFLGENVVDKHRLRMFYYVRCDFYFISLRIFTFFETLIAFPGTSNTFFRKLLLYKIVFK